MKTMDRIIDKGGRENPGLDDKTMAGVQTPDLEITQEVLFGRQKYVPKYSKTTFFVADFSIRSFMPYFNHSLFSGWHIYVLGCESFQCGSTLEIFKFGALLITKMNNTIMVPLVTW